MMLVVAVALVAAIGGFMGGFTVGQRTVSSPSSSDSVESVPVAPATSPQPRPEGTQGRTFTDDAVDSASSPAAADSPTSTSVPAEPPDTTAEASSPVAGQSSKTADPSPATAPARPATPAQRRAEQSRSVPPRQVPVPRAGLEPGSMEVLSRPSGAQVFVDGALVGRTPLSLRDVAPGAHAVGISLPGHRRWATSVDVRPGGQTRVAASLETAPDPQ